MPQTAIDRYYRAATEAAADATAKTARENLHERRALALANTRKVLIEALYRLEEADKYPDLTCNDARRELRTARSCIEEAELFSKFGIDERVS